MIAGMSVFVCSWLTSGAQRGLREAWDHKFHWLGALNKLNSLMEKKKKKSTKWFFKIIIKPATALLGRPLLVTNETNVAPIHLPSLVARPGRFARWFPRFGLRVEDVRQQKLRPLPPVRRCTGLQKKRDNGRYDHISIATKTVSP